MSNIRINAQWRICFEWQADTALRLARYLNMSPRFWLGLQMDYDLDVANDQIGERLNQEVAVLVND